MCVCVHVYMAYVHMGIPAYVYSLKTLKSILARKPSKPSKLSKPSKPTYPGGFPTP